ncbi:hypothetical protein BX661DRAFT_182598 [Kickxella alabastrina]|uniref:uncharacterized protein n=1 Tax=Kickxella alabastrina TaxID=61397 RepID=UPI00222056A7|nr:uncharacterized protein BX661DRAFT_182598 [Kickxella alabastrina]KAI7827853.1 hypothetical protein BX661DRAFT_182598 [Kickxella alabastrina]KAJ1944528.1 hypothetical protein GGF37_002150 [Kickxella alabastrina]
MENHTQSQDRYEHIALDVVKQFGELRELVDKLNNQVQQKCIADTVAAPVVSGTSAEAQDEIEKLHIRITHLLRALDSKDETIKQLRVEARLCSKPRQ